MSSSVKVQSSGSRAGIPRIDGKMAAFRQEHQRHLSCMLVITLQVYLPQAHHTCNVKPEFQKPCATVVQGNYSNHLGPIIDGFSS